MRQSRQKQAAVEKSLSRPSCASATQLGNAQWLFGEFEIKPYFFQKNQNTLAQLGRDKDFSTAACFCLDCLIMQE